MKHSRRIEDQQMNWQSHGHLTFDNRVKNMQWGKDTTGFNSQLTKKGFTAT